MTDKEKANVILDLLIELSNQIIDVSNNFMELRDEIYSKAGYNYCLIGNLADSINTFASDCKFRLKDEMQQSNTN